MTNNPQWRFPEEQYWYPLAPRQHPKSPPSVGIFDEPTRCVRVNAEWWSHVSGVIALLSDPDAWTGTDEEKKIAEHQINLLLGETDNCGVEDIRVQGCILQKLENGVWVDVADLTACGGGGGGGVSALTVTTYNPAETAQKNGTNTAYDSAVNRDVVHNFTRSKALIQYTIAARNQTAGEQSSYRIGIPATGGVTVASRNEGKVTGTDFREVTFQAVFDNIPSGNRQFWVEAMTTAGGTWAIQSNFVATVVIIEYENADDLYVTANRIFNRELQYKIAGVWITATDSLATILNGIESIAVSAQNTANNALTQATNALSVANGAVSVNNTQNTRLTNIENDIGDINLSISQLNTTVADHEARIAALEAAISSDEGWAGYKFGQITHITAAPGFGYSSILNSYNNSIGGWIPNGSNIAEIFAANAMRFGACVHVRVSVQTLAGFSGNLFVSVNDEPFEALMLQSSSSGANAFTWLNVTPRNDTAMKIVVRNIAGNTNWLLKGVTYLCLVINPFTGDLFT